jgi:hypothetical protein
VRQELLSKFKEYFARHYDSFDSSADLYTYFMEKGVRILRPGGYFSIIVSSSFLRATFGEPLRKTLRKDSRVIGIVDFGGIPIFANAKDTYVCIPLILKATGSQPVHVRRIQALGPKTSLDGAFGDEFDIPAEQLSSEAWSLASPKACHELFARNVCTM